MRHIPTVVCVAAICACASAPRGPSEAEMRTRLDSEVQSMVQAILGGAYGDLVTWFTPDGRLILNGLIGPDGMAMNVDLTGHGQILNFLNSVGAPPDFGMQVSEFRLTGGEARQTGRWWIGSDQGGSFALDWRRTGDDRWRIYSWRFDAGAM